MNPPKRAYNYRYELHACLQSPSSWEVIGFDIYLSWRLAKTDTEPAGSWTDAMVLRSESHFMMDNDEFAPIFDCRVVWRADQASKLKLRCGGRKFRSFLRGCGSGGNWHWEVYILPQKREAHLLNWLRRCAIDPTEWDSEFVDRIWKQRGPIRRENLKAFARAGACSWPDKTMDASNRFRSGTMCKPSTETRGVAWWMSYLAAFRAKTSALPEAEKDSTENKADCGEKCGESWAKYDRETSLWKTAQLSLFGGLESCSETWPRWGMMLDGECWVLAMPAHLTRERESGLWLTPNANDSKPAGQKEVEMMRIYELGTNVPDTYKRLRSQVAARTWPTPTAQDAKNNGAPSQMVRNTKPLNAEIGGPLNPEWVEWLMGWPIGWTALEHLATAKFRLWPLSHGITCDVAEGANDPSSATRRDNEAGSRGKESNEK